jgi:hypothetical protein
MALFFAPYMPLAKNALFASCQVFADLQANKPANKLIVIVKSLIIITQAEKGIKEDFI